MRRITCRFAVETLERRDAPTVTPTGAEFRVNTAITNSQSAPAIAADNAGNFVVVWESLQNNSDFDIFAQRYDKSGTALGSQFLVNNYTTGDQRSPAIAMDAEGDFVVTFESYGQDGDAYGVYARRYNASGAALGTAFSVNSTTTNSQFSSAAAMDAAGDFVIAWESYGQTGDDGDGVYFQRYNAAGVAQGGETRANATTTQFQSNPAVCMDTSGDFVIAWESYTTDGSGNGIYARRYNSSGVSQGPGEFRVSQFSTSNQQSAAVALDGVGDFVVAWESYGQDGSGYGIYARRYSSSGAALANEFRVNSTTADEQRNPSIVMDSAGDFVVAWSSFGQEASNYGIYGQRYLSSGGADGGEFHINTYSTDQQTHPAAAGDTAGNFVVVWQSEGQDTSSSGIYGQRFQAADVPPPRVQSTVVNGGEVQRSMVTQLVVTFDQTVTLPATPASAFTMIGPNGSVTMSATVTSTNPTTVQLTFSGNNTSSGSLNDGLYTLTVLQSQVTAAGGHLDGNGDGVGGDNYQFSLYRLFGDIDGNGTVDAADFLQFRLAFLTASGSPGFLSGFDYDGSGFIDAADFLQFRLRFLISI